MKESFHHYPLERLVKQETEHSKAVLARIRSAATALPPAEQRVAALFEEQPARILRLPINALAAEARVSEATVVRFCRSLGFSGLRELKLQLAGEISSPAELVHQSVQPSDDTATVLAKVMRADIQAITDALAMLDTDAVERAVQLLHSATRIQCFGTGVSAPIVQEACYRFLRLGLPASAESNWHNQAVSAAHLPPGSIAFAVSRTGTTAQTLSGLRWARRAGARIVVLTNYRGRKISELADVEIIVAAPDDSIRPEAASTRIAHLAVVDALCVALAMKNPTTASAALVIDDQISDELGES